MENKEKNINFNLVKLSNEVVRDAIKICQKNRHIQQVAFSTYHDCLTQVCFTCKKIRTSMKQKNENN